jgi:hypothetical protein
VGRRSTGKGRRALFAGGGGHLPLRDHDAGRGVDVLHGKMKVAPCWFCDLICFPGRMFEFDHIVWICRAAKYV